VFYVVFLSTACALLLTASQHALIHASTTCMYDWYDTQLKLTLIYYNFQQNGCIVPTLHYTEKK